jgi:Flp pilus assembly protein TadD
MGKSSAIVCIAAFTTMLGAMQPAQAAYNGWAAIRKFAIVNDHIERGRYEDATALLEQMISVQPDDADAHSLMGFSLRKSGDFDNALISYRRALSIDAGHLGANEYLGELYLETGETEKARDQLTVLEGLCGQGCAEYEDLRAAIALVE